MPAQAGQSSFCAPCFWNSAHASSTSARSYFPMGAILSTGCGTTAVAGRRKRSATVAATSTRPARRNQVIAMCTATLLADPMTTDAGDVRAAGAAALAAGFTEMSAWAHHIPALDGLVLRIGVIEA